MVGSSLRSLSSTPSWIAASVDFRLVPGGLFATEGKFPVDWEFLGRTGTTRPCMLVAFCRADTWSRDWARLRTFLILEGSGRLGNSFMSLVIIGANIVRSILPHADDCEENSPRVRPAWGAALALVQWPLPSLRLLLLGGYFALRGVWAIRKILWHELFACEKQHS